ncbi:DNA-3-methyladenine glycosylase family protein [Halococcoides cellulosivorans]|uniref:DNA-3-methyladenine glycosylase 2 family protein n=1 Tax=Halococcoides cellulosivorans TaxID=1679096 RepID=A0A2R4X222_9EURY|nr:DNA-3-methyladenine glycosylase [Halococcoides cellulosivorans]AWB27834.1 DNA-3-methyladenine glycosylase 2 family protein [Halococcoides cellulosivorans]
MSGPIATLRDDPDLGPVVERVGPVTIEAHADPFRRLVVSIVRQQLSMASARSIREQLFEAVEPTPDAILGTDPAALADAGLSTAKVEALRAVARAHEDHDWPAAFADQSDREVTDALTAIHGIGPWTAKMYLIFALGREDVFPVEDLGVRRAMERLFDDPTRAEMRSIAERWAPYRSYAARYLWALED